MAKNSQGKTNFGKKIIIILVLAVILGVSCIFSAQIDKLIGIGYKGSAKGEAEKVFASDLIINYIDVGQGDSTYIEFPNGETMLIDASEKDYGQTIINYIKGRQGIEDATEPVIDYLILTHSDSDHSGGMEYVFANSVINNIYRPFELAMDKTDPTTCYALEDLKAYKDTENISLVTTDVYRNFIKAVYSENNEEGNPANVYVSYDNLTIGGNEDGFLIEFFMPEKLSNETLESNSNVFFTKGYPVKPVGPASARKNNSSPILLLEYKEFSFVFSGDAEKEVEEAFLNSLSKEEKERFYNTSVFQAGHHGSTTSNTTAFMELLTPTYTVVSCGKDNKYGHPTDKFLKTLNALNHKVDDYLIRTDLNGNIVFGATDGTLIYISGVEVAVGKVVRWYHIAIVLFVGLSIVIISIKFKRNGSVTKTSVRKGNRAAKKVVKRYFD